MMHSPCTASSLLGSREAVTGQAAKLVHSQGCPSSTPHQEHPYKHPGPTPLGSQAGWAGLGQGSRATVSLVRRLMVCVQSFCWKNSCPSSCCSLSSGAAPRSLCPFPTASPRLSADWSPYGAANCSTSALQSQLADGLPKAWIHRLLTVQTFWQKKKKSHKTKIGNNIQMWHFRRSISGYCPPTQVLSWNWSK